jgi:iron complex outermembrane receptor protein
MKRYSHALRGALILSTAFVPLASVHAAGATAEAPPPPPGAEADVATGGDIIVTARRQDEKIQRVPISIAVIDSKALARGTLSDLKDVQFLAPSLTVSTNNTRNTDNLSLRGVGTTYGTDQAVVAYFAEVPLPGGGGGAGNLFDLGNVQVLNGPQGTLFGRNTTGGAQPIASKGKLPSPMAIITMPRSS